MKLIESFTPLIKDEIRLKILLSEIPNDSGCYLMHDNNDRLLYVGKSKNLRNRIKKI